MPDCITANQLVAYNLMRIRKTLGLSQEEAAKRLRPYIGAEWSKTVYSTTERSYHGNRVRQFTADDLLAFSRAFEVPVIYFFMPPRPEDREIGSGDARREVSGVCGGTAEVSWPELFDVMLGGEMAIAVAQRIFELPRDERVNADSLLTSVIGSPRSIAEYIDVKSRVDAADLANRHTPEEDTATMPPVVAAIVTSDQGVLVGRRNDGKPPWTFIAGEQDAVKDESPADTAVREVKEETGLRISAGEVIGERVHPKTGRTMIYIAAAPTHGTDILVGDENELAEVRWVSLDEADELLPGMYEPVREHLARELRDPGEF